MKLSTSSRFFARGLFLISIAAGLSAAAADWSQFMGPKGDGTSEEHGLARSWPAGGPKVLWTVPLGRGYGGAAIREGKVYFLDRVEQKQDVLRCLDLNTGKEDWSLAYDAPGRVDHDGSRSTPAVTDKYIFTIGTFGHLQCVDRATHKVVWQKNLLEAYTVKLPRWGVAQSPVVDGDRLIVAPQSNQAGIAALDPATGKELWHSGPIGQMAYGSPMKVSVDGVDQFVIVTTLGPAAVSAKDGKVLWKYSHPCGIPVPNVTALGDGRFFVTAAYRAGSAIIQVTHQGDDWAVKEVARNDQIGGHCHPGLLYKNHIYVLCNVNERRDGLVCFDEQAKVVWQTRNEPNLDKGGSILTGDGLIYQMDGKTGELHIVEPSPDGFKSLGKAKLLGGVEIWAPLALSDGKLVIRDQSQAKCLDIKAQ